MYIWDVYIRRRLHLYDSGTPINIFISVQPPSMHKQCGKVWKSMHKQCGKIDEGDLSISIWMEHPNMAGEDIHTCLIFQNIKYPQNWCVCVYKYKIPKSTTTTTHFNNFTSLTFRIACTSRLKRSMFIFISVYICKAMDTIRIVGSVFTPVYQD